LFGLSIPLFAIRVQPGGGPLVGADIAGGASERSSAAQRTAARSTRDDLDMLRPTLLCVRPVYVI